ncbi:MAG: GtrA family protein [archaeon]|nr:GtrA family protein [archaeon]
MSVRSLIDKLFYGKHGEAMRYMFFGVLNVIVTWVSYAALVLVGVDPVISNAASWVIGVAFAFVVNKLFVFNSKTTEVREVGKEAATFTLGRIITGVFAIVGFPILYNLGLNGSLLGVDGFLAKIIVSAVEIILNYFFSKYLVFQKKE